MSAPTFVEYLELGMVVLVSSFCLSAVERLPMWGLMKDSTRSSGTDFEFASSFSLPPENLVTLLIPTFFGDGKSAPYWGRWFGWEVMGYVGILPLVLAAVAVVYAWSRARERPQAEACAYKMTWFCFAMAIIAVMLALGRYLPGYRWLYEHAPGISQFRAPGRMLVFWTVAVSAWRASGWKCCSIPDLMA